MVRFPGAGGATPRVSSVCGSNTTGIGVSVSARNSSPDCAILTLALSPNDGGENIDAMRLNRDRQGSVANSE
jgi:hypothetical protein